MKAQRVKYLFLILLLALVGSRLTAQIHVSGTIIDANTSTPLPNVSVTVKGTAIGASSNMQGEFRLENLPAGKWEIIFTHVSYLEKTIGADIHASAELPVIRLEPAAHELKDVFITADRMDREAADVPANIYLISGNLSQVYAINNADEMLSLIPGIRIDRDRGVFSKNSSISMRGLNGSARTLVMLDGVPLNKADGAGINWSRIDPDLIERIEVMKGPNSTIYGSNAMAGVVNIITNHDPGAFRARFKTFYGTYNTCGGNFSASGSMISKGKGAYWSMNSFYRRGDGFIPVADSLKGAYDTATYLTEMGLVIKAGYQFSPSRSLEAEYSNFWDLRGDGNKIYEKYGSYNQYPTQSARISYHGIHGKWQFNVNGFYQLEHYYRQNETIKKQTGKYTLYHTDSRRTDAGLWITAAHPLNGKGNVKAGLDVKSGSVAASDLYYTSTDILNNKGKMDLAAAFVQYESPLWYSKLKLETGLRLDIANFHNGSFSIEDPTSLTEFMTLYPSVFHDTSWMAVSPRVALLYKFSKNVTVYGSYAHGFRPPTLDDMCRNGNVTKGFKLANPSLGPEHLDNYEIGYTARLLGKLLVEQSLFYSAGRDFQYFVANGDSVYTGGSNLKPVLQRNNISRVSILGTEISLNWQLIPSLLLYANYAYNHSKVGSSETSNGKSLEGKTLMEVPANQCSAGVEWRYLWMMAGASFAYTDKIYADDDNLVVNPARTETGLKVSATYHEKVYISMGVQDLFNHRYIDSKGNISPGRFFMATMVWKIGNN